MAEGGPADHRAGFAGRLNDRLAPAPEERTGLLGGGSGPMAGAVEELLRWKWGSIGCPGSGGWTAVSRELCELPGHRRIRPARF